MIRKEESKMYGWSIVLEMNGRGNIRREGGEEVLREDCDGEGSKGG